jgi:hypothetical protein
MTANPDNDFIIAIADTLLPVSGPGFFLLSPAEQVVVLIWGLEADVNNGGFNQYFFNSYSDHSGAVPHALRAIGAAQTAQIVDRALALFPGGSPPPDQTRRQALLEELDPDTDHFETIDREFFAYPDNLTSLLVQFVRANSGSVRGA